MINMLLERKNRVRFEKLGSGAGNLIGLLRDFGSAVAYLVAGRRGKSFIMAVERVVSLALRWKGGTLGLVKYLKASQITLMQVVSKGPVSDSRLLGGVHRRGLGSLPGIIPYAHRVSIMRGDVPTIRLWLSLLGVYRIIECPGKSSYQTITQPKRTDISQPLAEFSSFLKWAKGNIPLCGKILKRVPVPKLAFKPLAILTSGPNVPPETGAVWAVVFDALAIWHARDTSWYRALEDYCLRTMNTKVLGLIRDAVGSVPNRLPDASLDWVSKNNHKVGRTLRERTLYILRVIDRFVEYDEEGSKSTRTRTGYMFARTWLGQLRLGRIHEIPEPAGKVRVVAMVTWWIQCLLYPLHDYIFQNILRLIPQDGTHDQGKPLLMLNEKIVEFLSTTGKAHVYSFDLKAATDRIPSELTVSVLGNLVTPAVAKSWRELLVGIPYSNVSFRKRDRHYFGEAQIRYGTGMPMGAYSNWAMLALVHHLIVQFAAYKAGFRGWYELYALLGDDIVILGTAVAKQYEALCKAFGIQIGLAKSLISPNGSYEFAKRFYVRGVDASPISVREYWVSQSNLPSFIELVARAKRVKSDLRLADVIRAYAKGYRVVSELTQRIAKLGNTRVANLITALLLPGAPFESTLEAIFSTTSTAVNPVGKLEDTPITDRRVKSVARSLGDSLKQIAGSKQEKAKSFLSEAKESNLVQRGRSLRLRALALDVGIAPMLAFNRLLAILDRSREIEVLRTFGVYLNEGRLNSRGLITLLGKIIPIWKHAIGDVAAIPDPTGLEPAGVVLQRAKLQKILRIRIAMLGLKWHENRKPSIKNGRTGNSPFRRIQRIGTRSGGGGQQPRNKADSRRVRDHP
jgi:hypothetical protein